jgi:hypothetical protein
MKAKLKIISILLFFILFSFSSFSQSYKYTLKQNILHVSDCANPKEGFILTGNTISKNANNDSFSLNVDNDSFAWTDNKGTSNNKIYNFKSKSTALNTQFVFATESNLIRITTNNQKEAVIEIICLLNNQWKCMSFLCKVVN